MQFGSVPLDKAAGAVLAHSLKVGGVVFKKGTILGIMHLDAIANAGLETVTVARLGAKDVPEDQAALRIATAVAGEALANGEATTGRVNLHAAAPGLVVVDKPRLDRLNAIHESVTVATLPAFTPVPMGEMVATIKIIPFAAPESVVSQAETIAAESGPPIRVAAFGPLSAVLIQTRLPGLKESVLDKTAAVTRNRLEALGGQITREVRCAHDQATLAEAIEAVRGTNADLLLIAGASAITDRRDVLPAAIVVAGGTIEHFGMPVDPGNLLLLAKLGSKPVLGLPGCARSPKLNGFDWILRRLSAGIPVVRPDIMAMGVGGLLSEIPSRPQPRSGGKAEAPDGRPTVAAVVLAAGSSSRMGPLNKLLAELEGKPLIRHTVEAVVGSWARPVIVVTGHEANRVAKALHGLDVRLVHNEDYEQGLSTSLKAGLAAIPAGTDGVLICLGDMPRLSTLVCDRLIAAFHPGDERTIVVPMHRGRRGNPILWDARFAPDMMELTGDHGARKLLDAFPGAITNVPIASDGILTDVDTPEALAALRSDKAETMRR